MCPLSEKYGTFIERCNALIEKVSPFIGRFLTEDHWELPELELNQPHVTTQGGAGLVAAWLSDCGGHVQEQTHGYIRAELGAAAAEGCFGVRLSVFRHAATRRMTVATADVYTVPSEIAPLLDFVSGLRPPPASTDRFSRPWAVAHATPSFSLTPSIVRNLYSLPEATSIPNTTNHQAVAASTTRASAQATFLLFNNEMRCLLRPPRPLGRLCCPKVARGRGSW
eukprot:SAG31_NODE_1834_length_7135_cov_6.903923_6_plen_224_part_00